MNALTPASSGITWLAVSLRTTSVRAAILRKTQGGTRPVIALLEWFELDNGALRSYGAGTKLQKTRSALMANSQTRGHFVVVDGFNRAGELMIRDPAGMSYTMKMSQFRKYWSGWILGQL